MWIQDNLHGRLWLQRWKLIIIQERYGCMCVCSWWWCGLLWEGQWQNSFLCWRFVFTLVLVGQQWQWWWWWCCAGRGCNSRRLLRRKGGWHRVWFHYRRSLKQVIVRISLSFLCFSQGLTRGTRWWRWLRRKPGRRPWWIALWFKKGCWLFCWVVYNFWWEVASLLCMVVVIVVVGHHRSFIIFLTTIVLRSFSLLLFLGFFVCINQLWDTATKHLHVLWLQQKQASPHKRISHQNLRSRLYLICDLVQWTILQCYYLVSAICQAQLQGSHPTNSPCLRTTSTTPTFLGCTFWSNLIFPPLWLFRKCVWSFIILGFAFLICWQVFDRWSNVCKLINLKQECALKMRKPSFHISVVWFIKS